MCTLFVKGKIPGEMPKGQKKAPTSVKGLDFRMKRVKGPRSRPRAHCQMKVTGGVHSEALSWTRRRWQLLATRGCDRDLYLDFYALHVKV